MCANKKTKRNNNKCQCNNTKYCNFYKTARYEEYENNPEQQPETLDKPTVSKMDNSYAHSVSEISPTPVHFNDLVLDAFLVTVLECLHVLKLGYSDNRRICNKMKSDDSNLNNVS